MAGEAGAGPSAGSQTLVGSPALAQDFHSIRVTWITLALAAGVSLELIQRVTGHRAVAMLLKNYFGPGREDFRAVLTKALPKMLGDGGHKPSSKHEMNRILEWMTAKSWQADQELTFLRRIGSIPCAAF